MREPRDDLSLVLRPSCRRLGLGRRVGKFRLEALEEVAEALGRDASLLEDAHGMPIGLSLGHARVAKLRQQQADVGGRARGSGENKLAPQPTSPSPCTSPASGWSSIVWPISWASTPATSSGEPAFCTSPRVMMICPPGVAKALTSAQSIITTRTGVDVVGCRDETAGQAVERDAAGSGFALLHVAGELGNDAAPHRLARLLRQHPGDGLGRVQLEQPHAWRPAPPQCATVAMPGRRPSRRWRVGDSPLARANSACAERRVGHEQGLRAVGFQAQQHVGRVRLQRHVALQLGVGPHQRGAAFAGRQESPGPLRRGAPRTATAAAVRPSLSLPS